MLLRAISRSPFARESLPRAQSQDPCNLHTTLVDARSVQDTAGAIIALHVSPASDLRRRLLRFFFSSLLGVLALLALTYAVDFTILRIRIATNRNPYGSVTVNHYYAIPQKNGKTPFIFDPPGPQTCVNSLFPHGGSLPCWYLTRHPDQRTDM